MAFIRFLIGLFYKEENKLERNLEEWNSCFEKGKLKKGRRFRQIAQSYFSDYVYELLIIMRKIASICV